MAGHKHGDMDVAQHEKTFDGFVKACVWVVMVVTGVFVFLAIFNS